MLEIADKTRDVAESTTCPATNASHLRLWLRGPNLPNCASREIELTDDKHTILGVVQVRFVIPSFSITTLNDVGLYYCFGSFHFSQIISIMFH